MKLTKLNSERIVNVNLGKYSIDWDRKVSAPQLKVKTFLRPYWQSDAIYEEVLIPGSLLRVDLLNSTRMIIVEVSPDSVHRHFNTFMHKNRFNLLKKIKADMDKRKWAESNGFRFIELEDQDLKNLSKDLINDKFGVML